MTEDEVEKQRVRSQAAKDILNNPLFKDIVNILEVKYMHQIRWSSIDETEKRDNAYLMLQALDAIVTEIGSAGDGAKVVNFNQSLRRPKNDKE